MDDDALRDKARELIRTGRLPDRSPKSVWGGTSRGEAPCMLCGEPLRREDVFLEIELRRPDGSTYPQLHVRCFSAFEQALHDPGGTPTHPATPI